MNLSSNPIRVPPIISERTVDVLNGTLFDWVHPKLARYNRKLKESTRLIDLINETDSKTFQYIVKESHPYTIQEYMDEFNGEMISTKWLIYWEILDKYFSSYLKDKRKQPMFNTLHLNEDSNTILALNHYISRHNLAWEWYGQGNQSIIKTNKKRWLDIECDNSANIRLLMHKFENKPLNFYTSNSPDTSLRSLYGQVLSGLAILGTGGNLIISCELTNSTTPIISVLYLLSIVFTNLYIHVPTVANTTTYIVGINYRGITSNNLKKLLDWFNDVEDNIIERMSIFKRTDVPQEFIDNVVGIIKKITELHVKIYTRSLMLYNEYKDKDIKCIVSDMEEIRKKNCEYWINKYHLFKLDESKEIIRNQIRL